MKIKLLPGKKEKPPNYIAHDLAFSLSASLWAEEMIKFTSDPWQAGLLDNAWKRTLLLCSRQSGKSTTTAALVLHTALYKAPADILLVSPGERQSGEILRKVKQMWKALPKLQYSHVQLKNDSVLKVEFSNGSRILALPGKSETIRGYSAIKLIVIDEASQVDDELYYTIRPMLAVSGGSLILLSTPWGKRGFFYDAWCGKDTDDWKIITVTADQCPRISKKFLQQEKESMGQWWYDQEYMCVFVDTSTQLFGLNMLELCVSKHIDPPLDIPVFNQSIMYKFRE